MTEGYDLPPAAKANRKMATISAFVALSTDAIHKVADVTVRRATWLHNWDVDVPENSMLIGLSFKREKLSSNPLDPMLIESRGNKVLPSREQLSIKLNQHCQNCSFHGSRFQPSSSFSTSISRAQCLVWQSRKQFIKSKP